MPAIRPAKENLKVSDVLFWMSLGAAIMSFVIYRLVRRASR